MKNPELQRAFETLLRTRLPSIYEYRKNPLMHSLLVRHVVARLRRKSRTTQERGHADPAHLLSSSGAPRKIVPKLEQAIVRFMRHCGNNPHTSFGAIYAALQLDEHKGARLRRQCQDAGYLDWKTRPQQDVPAASVHASGKCRGRPKEYPVVTDRGHAYLTRWEGYEIE